MTIICYFWKSLKPSIKVKIKQQDQVLTSFQEIVQRAVNAKAKAGIKSSTIVWDSDTRCPRGYCSFHNTSSKVQTESSKDSFRPKKPKPKDIKSAPSRNYTLELPKKDNKKNKKKMFQGQRWEYTRERKKQTPAISVNTTNVLKKKKKRYDVNRITCFNCNKKGHFASDYAKPKN